MRMCPYPNRPVCPYCIVCGKCFCRCTCGIFYSSVSFSFLPQKI